MTGQRRRGGWWPVAAMTAATALLGVATVQRPDTTAARASAAPSGGTGTLTGGSGGSGDNGNGKNNGGGNDKKDFLIAGNVTGLYPGSSRPLTVTVTNLNNFPIRVTSLTATVADPPGPCTAGVVRVDPMAGTLVVPKNGTATTVVTARMSDDPSNACKSTAFGLTYQGTAVKA